MKIMLMMMVSLEFNLTVYLKPKWTLHVSRNRFGAAWSRKFLAPWRWRSRCSAGVPTANWALFEANRSGTFGTERLRSVVTKCLFFFRHLKVEPKPELWVKWVSLVIYWKQQSSVPHIDGKKISFGSSRVGRSWNINVILTVGQQGARWFLSALWIAPRQRLNWSQFWETTDRINMEMMWFTIT